MEHLSVPQKVMLLIIVVGIIVLIGSVSLLLDRHDARSPQRTNSLIE